MRVVVIAPSLPVPFGKADERWLSVAVAGLARRGHDVLCISCTEEDETAVALAESRAASLGYDLRHVPLSLTPESTSRRRARNALTPFNDFAKVAQLRTLIDAEACTADVVHVEHLLTSRACLGLPNAVTYLHHLEVIDWEYRHDLDRKARLVRVQIERATRQILSQTSHLIGATSRVVARVKDIAPHLHTAVVPVSVDPRQFSVQAPPRQPTVGVIGSMNCYANRSAAERALRVWPAIRRQVPDARLLLAGLRSEDCFGHRFPIEGAELLGTVEDPQDFFSEISTLLYPPDRGSGFKIEVLESMACGRAVVSNNEGLEGVMDRPDIVPIRAESDDDFIVETVSLLTNLERCAELGAAGRQHVEDHYSPDVATDRLLDAYERLGFPTGRPSPQLAALVNQMGHEPTALVTNGTHDQEVAS